MLVTFCGCTACHGFLNLQFFLKHGHVRLLSVGSPVYIYKWSPLLGNFESLKHIFFICFFIDVFSFHFITHVTKNKIRA